jgi:S1-C subfamily serine protease
VIGNPYALGRSLTAGVISALGRIVHIDEQTVFRNMIQTDAAVNPGSSGGGLFDSSGRLIGIVSVLYSTQGGSMGIAFAVPASEVQALIDSSRIRESAE